MPPENAAAAVNLPTNVAPRREKRLVPTAPRQRKRSPTAPAVPQQPLPADEAKPLSAIESKVAALQDPAELLRLMHTEATLRRAQRLSGAGDSQRQTIRLLSICMLFALLAAAIGAMWYLQTSLQGSRRARGTPAAVSPAAPAPAAPGAPVAR